jgi:hypothetical protein
VELVQEGFVILVELKHGDVMLLLVLLVNAVQVVG